MKSKRSRKYFTITEKDEFKHILRKYPQYHNESWYFNFMDFNANVHLVTRVGFRLGEKELDVMLLLVVDGKKVEYFNTLKVDGFPSDEIYGDDKLKYECLEPLKKWRITYNGDKYEADILYKDRFTPYVYGSQEDPMETLKKYGMEILKIAASRHYEQGMNVTGVVKLKEKGQIKEERQINCYGHRDHSWGMRDWIKIDKWNWIACQFDDCTINSSRVEVIGKIIKQGFISTAKGHEQIIDVDVETEYGYEGKASVPKSSTFKIKTPTQQFTIISHTWTSFHLQRQTEQGFAEVHEQIVEFEMDGKKGYGISEYLKSTRYK